MASAAVVDHWTGPGRSDGEIATPAPREDGWHPSAQRGLFEHWYFDARLDDGHTIVGFLQSAELITKRPGVELHVYKPDGGRIEIRKPYPAAAVRASVDGCEVQVGANRVETDYPAAGLPVHHLFLDEDGVRFELEFRAEVRAWKPGLGRTDYGAGNYFAWVVGAPRAAVSGSIEYEGKRFEVTGTGYHDHNWGVGNMGRIVDHWYWGRVYADELTLVYADVTATPKYGGHASTPVMLAVGERPVLSTGEVEVRTGPAIDNEIAHRTYPSWLELSAGDSLRLRLDVREIIHAHDLLDDVPVIRSRPGKALVHRVLGRPGYFRFRSDFSLEAEVEGVRYSRQGSTLHEMVALR